MVPVPTPAHRRHVESYLRGVDVDLVTSRRTNPHTLTCTKNARSYEARVTQRAADLDALRCLGDALPERAVVHR